MRSHARGPLPCPGERRGALWRRVGLGLRLGMLASVAACTAVAAEPPPALHSVLPTALPTELVRYDAPLTPHEGDPQRGRALIVDRQKGFCLLCHSGPFPEERFQGTLAPSLAPPEGGRPANVLRARLAEPRLFNPHTIMPSYLTPAQGARIHPQFEGKALLTPQEVEDIVAFLSQMRP